MDLKELDEIKLGDIILCDPITSKGKNSLKNIGLTTEDVSPSFFYAKMRVESKFDKNNELEEQTNSPKSALYYQYTVDFEQYKEIEARLKNFNKRFSSNMQDEYPLLMLGVAGNGKSIEINRRIREITDGESEFECGRAYLDLEVAFTKKTYGVTYNCPNSNSSLWLFCIKLLDGIMQYIKKCHSLCRIIFENFQEIIFKNNLANPDQQRVFENIGNYCDGDNSTETVLFKSLIDLLSSQYADKDIQTLLEILMWVMYCSAPHEKHYIVIDNIEQYIKLNNLKIQIPNSDISVIYKSINDVVMTTVNEFNRIEQDLAWKAFKIIIVLRRTSMGLLGSTLLQSPVKMDANINDVTGHFSVSAIWEKKKKYIWDNILKNKFTDDKSQKLIEIIDFIMADDEHVSVGISYQSLIAPLMSYGIRRNARSQAHSAYKTYEILTSGDEKNITFQEYTELKSAISRVNPTIRYMFRRALIEFQFKWGISNKNQNRWKNLGIGHLTGKRTIKYHNQEIVIEDVSYFDETFVTITRRILTYLSSFPDVNNITENGRRKSVVDMFSTISIFNLINGIFTNPKGDNKISDNDYIKLARVLIALSDMSNADTKSAPYIILGINDARFHANTCPDVLADILKEILQAGEAYSLSDRKYNYNDFGVRITDAGYSFMLDWQASFSFMASLHCFTIPPLFFLKHVLSIKYVIETVYNASNKLCEMYEAEASRFCGNSKNITLKREKYLPKYNNKVLTFRQRTKELHINHLLLYRTFLENNYTILKMSESNMLELTDHSTGFISNYIKLYESWNTEEGAPECF